MRLCSAQSTLSTLTVRRSSTSSIRVEARLTIKFVGRAFSFLFLSKVLYICGSVYKTMMIMRRVIVTIAAMLAVCGLYAQRPDKTLAEAQIEYDRAVAAQRAAVDEARNEERRITDAAYGRREQARSQYETVRDEYRRVVEEQRRIVEEARARLDNADVCYRQEKARTKQEVTSARARRKAVQAEHKSAVSRARAEIARVRAAEHEARGTRD